MFPVRIVINPMIWARAVSLLWHLEGGKSSFAPTPPLTRAPSSQGFHGSSSGKSRGAYRFRQHGADEVTICSTAGRDDVELPIPGRCIRGVHRPQSYSTRYTGPPLLCALGGQGESWQSRHRFG